MSDASEREIRAIIASLERATDEWQYLTEKEKHDTIRKAAMGLKATIGMAGTEARRARFQRIMDEIRDCEEVMRDE